MSRAAVIDRAIQKVGSVKALAEHLGIAPQGVSQWERVPISHARLIMQLTGIPLYELRPDIWTPPDAAP